MTQIVDWASWPRRELFDFFSPMSQPFFSVTFRQDVTRLCQFAKENHISFYYALVYLCTAAREKSRAQITFLSGEDTPDLIYFSCLPWVEVTALTNERNFDPDDAVSRVAWGKYREEDGRKILHISLELNHRFVDGLHVGRFHEELTALIEAL